MSQPSKVHLNALLRSHEVEGELEERVEGEERLREKVGVVEEELEAEERLVATIIGVRTCCRGVAVVTPPTPPPVVV